MLAGSTRPAKRTPSGTSPGSGHLAGPTTVSVVLGSLRRSSARAATTVSPAFTSNVVPTNSRRRRGAARSGVGRHGRARRPCWRRRGGTRVHRVHLGRIQPGAVHERSIQEVAHGEHAGRVLIHAELSLTPPQHRLAIEMRKVPPQPIRSVVQQIEDHVVTQVLVDEVGRGGHREVLDLENGVAAERSSPTVQVRLEPDLPRTEMLPRHDPPLRSAAERGELEEASRCNGKGDSDVDDFDVGPALKRLPQVPRRVGPGAPRIGIPDTGEAEPHEAHGPLMRSAAQVRHSSPPRLAPEPDLGQTAMGRDDIECAGSRPKQVRSIGME